MESTHVNCRLCCSSYFSFARLSMMLLPSLAFSSSVTVPTERWRSSMAPVCACQQKSGLPAGDMLTIMTGHRSLAETEAKLEASEVRYWATRVSSLGARKRTTQLTGLWIEFHVYVQCPFG